MHSTHRHNPITYDNKIAYIFKFIRNPNCIFNEETEVANCGSCNCKIQKPIQYIPCILAGIFITSFMHFINMEILELLYDYIPSPIVCLIAFLILVYLDILIFIRIPSAFILVFGKWRPVSCCQEEIAEWLKLLKRERKRRVYAGIIMLILGSAIGAIFSVLAF